MKMSQTGSSNWAQFPETGLQSCLAVLSELNPETPADRNFESQKLSKLCRTVTQESAAEDAGVFAQCVLWPHYSALCCACSW